jgi:hypothetical protein
MGAYTLLLNWRERVSADADGIQIIAVGIQGTYGYLRLVENNAGIHATCEEDRDRSSDQIVVTELTINDDRIHATCEP